MLLVVLELCGLCFLLFCNVYTDVTRMEVSSLGIRVSLAIWAIIRGYVFINSGFDLNLLSSAFLALVVSYVLAFVLFAVKGVAFGDVRVLGVLGAYVGVLQLVFVLVAAIFVASMWGLSCTLFVKACKLGSGSGSGSGSGLRMELPFVPFISVGVTLSYLLMALFYGDISLTVF